MEKSGFNPGPVLHFTHAVRSRATPKPGPNPNFAKPNGGLVSGASKVEGTSSNPQGQSNTTNMTKKVDIFR